jgi:hypothetical protein
MSLIAYKSQKEGFDPSMFSVEKTNGGQVMPLH